MKIFTSHHKKYKACPGNAAYNAKAADVIPILRPDTFYFETHITGISMYIFFTKTAISMQL